MARNGSGTYALPAGNPVETNTVISSVVQNNTMTDIGTALTGSIARDGQSPATADIPMGDNKLTGLATPTTRTDATSLGSIVDGVGVYGATVGGTGNAITVTLAPVLTAYAAGQKFSFIAGAANTGAVTVNLNSVGAKAITKVGTTALVANDILSGSLVEMEYDGTRFQLLSPIGTDPTGTYLPLAGGTLTGDLNMSAKSVNGAVHTEAAHATTSDIWSGGNTCLLSGGVVTFTDVADAPQAGAIRYVVANAAHVITDNAALEMDGNANYTCAVGDVLMFTAKTTSTFRVNVLSHGDTTGDYVPSAVAITGGTINGTTIGASTPAAGDFTTLDATGVATATTFEPDGDTSASDNAAIGYTAAEGLVLTGQGSSGDVTIKNDADAKVMEVLTGTTTAAFAGQVTGTGFTGTLDGILGSGTPAAATTTTLNTSGAVVFNDAGADVDFRVEGDTDANLLVVDASTNNVGIGIASPLYKLDINGIAGWGANQTAPIANIVGANAPTNGGGNLRILSNTAAATDAGGSLVLGGYYSAQSSSIDFAEISGRKQTGQTSGGYLTFATRANLGNQTERMRIDSAGNVGIGTSAPINNLQVHTSASSGGQIQIGNASTGATTGDGVIIGFDGSNDVIINNKEATQMKFYTSGTERMKITAAGLGLSQFTAKAWVNFNGTGTPAITDSYNISSITDDGAGQYRVNFTVSPANGNFASFGDCMSGTGVGSSGNPISTGAYNAGAITVSVGTGGASPTWATHVDISGIRVLVFGD